jgi:pilus assembly protein CpaF
VFTKQLEDRSRKIMEIIEGEDFVDGKLSYRTLYQYDVTDNATDKKGNVKVVGQHKKDGNISDFLKKRFLDNGISSKELSQFLYDTKSK